MLRKSVRRKAQRVVSATEKIVTVARDEASEQSKVTGFHSFTHARLFDKVFKVQFCYATSHYADTRGLFSLGLG